MAKRMLPYAFAAAIIAIVMWRYPLDRETLRATFDDRWLETAAAAVLFTLHLAMNVFAFRQTLSAFGANVPAAFLRQAYAASVLAKYLPGGVWQVAGRVGLLKARGVPLRVGFAATVFEQFVALSSCGSLAAALFFFDRHLAIALLAVALALLAPIALGGVAAKISSVRAQEAVGIDAKRGMRAAGWQTLSLLPFVLGYLALWPVRGMDVSVAASVLAGTFAGLVAIFVPGGLGVREAVATEWSGADAQMMLATLLFARLVIAATEVAFFLVVGRLRRA